MFMTTFSRIFLFTRRSFPTKKDCFVAIALRWQCFALNVKYFDWAFQSAWGSENSKESAGNQFLRIDTEDFTSRFSVGDKFGSSPSSLFVLFLSPLSLLLEVLPQPFRPSDPLSQKYHPIFTQSVFRRRAH